MYALVEFKGKQYKAEKGALLKVDRIEADEGSALDIDTVLLIGGEKVAVGAPYVKGAKVSAVVESHGRDKRSWSSSTSPRRTIAVCTVIARAIHTFAFRISSGRRSRHDTGRPVL